MPKLNDLSRSLTCLDPDGTLIAVIEMSLSSRLVAGIVPGVERQPSKMLEVDENVLLKLINRWREEAQKAGQGIERADYFFFRTSRKASDIASNKKITASANSLFLRKYSFIAEHLTRSDGFSTRSNPLQIFT